MPERTKLFHFAGRVKRTLQTLVPWQKNMFPFGWPMPHSWPLLPETCPCDVDFCGYLKEHRVSRKSVFHFGSGGHHLVGLRNREDALENEILAITASPVEHLRYVKLVTQNPTMGAHYKVLFANIYDLGALSLPPFDVITLFHLCEYTRATDRRQRMDDAGVLDLFRLKLTAGGRLLFYDGSIGRAATRRIVQRAVDDGKLCFDEQYRSLLIFKA